MAIVLYRQHFNTSISTLTYRTQICIVFSHRLIKPIYLDAKNISLLHIEYFLMLWTAYFHILDIKLYLSSKKHIYYIT